MSCLGMWLTVTRLAGRYIRAMIVAIRTVRESLYVRFAMSAMSCVSLALSSEIRWSWALLPLKISWLRRSRTEFILAVSLSGQ